MVLQIVVLLEVVESGRARVAVTPGLAVVVKACADTEGRVELHVEPGGHVRRRVIVLGVHDAANGQDHDEIVSVAVQVVLKGHGKVGVARVCWQYGEVWHKNGTGARTDVVLEASDIVGPEPGEVDTNEKGVAVDGETMMTVVINVSNVDPSEANVSVEVSVEELGKGTTGTKELSLDEEPLRADEDSEIPLEEGA